MDGFFERLIRVQKPAQYTGGEYNVATKPFDSVAVRCALAFPDSYAMGMSCLGFKVVHHLFQRRDDALAERFFAPEPDMEALMRAEGAGLASLESRRPMGDFELVAFSLQTELHLTNVLAMLDLAGIPLRAADRTEDHPLVVAGGGGVLAPEPTGPFFDLLLAGDGEAIVDPLVETLAACRRQKTPRAQTLEALAVRVPGAYAPALYDRIPSPAGLLIPSPRPGTAAPRRVFPALALDLDAAPFPTAPPVPNLEVPHDRISLEIMRGCPHGCRFCEAGFTRRPLRMRKPETLLRLAEESYRATGYDEVSLLALSAGDYPGLESLVEEIHRRFEGRAVNVSLPSLRVDDALARLPALLNAVRRSGLTLAPEAGCRLRGALNKDIRDEDLFAAADRAWEEGWQLIKLYFMVGLPGETPEDLDAIAALADEVARRRGRFRGSAGKVNATVSVFVPRPHTPFQWEAQTSPREARAAFDRILARRRIKSVRYKFHSPERAVLEGALARGDANVSGVVLAAFRAGARFDAWDDRFDFRLWEAAFAGQGIALDAQLFAPRDPGLDNPWDVMAAGPAKNALRAERARALEGRPSPSCAPGRCTGRCDAHRDACAFL